jgi:ubiquinone/menaquinone biosynthesis C-methylase UbiE
MPALILAEHGCVVTGVDLEDNSLEKARQWLAKTPSTGQVTFLEGNLLDLPFESETFDLMWRAMYCSMSPIKHLLCENYSAC